MKLIYGEQAVIDDVDIHATPHNVLYKYKSKAVILCECDQMLWEFDQLEGSIDIRFVGYRTFPMNDRGEKMTKITNELQFSS